MCALVIGAILSKKIDVPGAVAGGVLTGLLWLGCSWLGVGLMATLFILGSVASRWGRVEKEKYLQEEGEVFKEKRGLPNVLANGFVAGAAGLAAWLIPDQQLLWTAVAAGALAAATSDTLASELGTRYGKRFVHVLRFAPMRRGEDGAISLEGSFAGVVGAVLVGLVCGLGTQAWNTAVLVAGAGVFGNWLDSVLGVSLQRRGLLNNHTVNFWCTVGAGAVVCVGLL
ncbi:MAG: DUF92 domain-containing protein [Bacteroidia bacterium]